MKDQQSNPSDRHHPGQSRRYRFALSILLVALTVSYITVIIAGLLPENRRIDTVALLIIGLTVLTVIVLLRPETFSRLKLLELSGFKVEMLEEVKERQDQQGSQLSDIALMLPLLLPETERRHLLNLANRTTANYKGSHALRTELRRLRSIGLIRMRSDKHVGQITDDLAVNLADYCELTSLGERWVNRIRAIETLDLP